jgi:NAD(P)-dependent dehydrogenase (short-subunit alcohol dehydrogenase family)
MGYLEGHSALVTGGARGIGRATAERLATRGACVFVLDRVTPTDTIDAPGQITWLRGDVTSPEDLENVAAAAAAAAPLYACVANAGILLIEDLIGGSVDSWRRVFEVNVLGVMVTLQAAAKAMVARSEGGRLVATASIAGMRGEAGSSAYSASKAAVVNLAQSLAVELAPHSINVNAVAPGEVDTEMHAAAMSEIAPDKGLTPTQLREQITQNAIPLSRLARPADVADVIEFLISPAADYLTGLTIRVDGGQLLL